MTKSEYVFGQYRLRPGRDMIASGVPVPLGTKALDVLAALVEAEGELVTKDELMDRVWPDLVVEEHNIQVHVSALRKVMGSDARWILTVPRCGYRFVGPVALGGTVGPALGRPLNRLFGREDDLMSIRVILDAARLVTLVGPGGIGKTRLGLEVARAIGDRYRDGDIFVDLSVVQDPSLVPSQVAAALGIELKGDTPRAELLARRLKSQELLILLDNCEHVVTAVAVLAELILAEAPLVSLVATSREPLACAGEQVYRLPPLLVPAEGVSSAVEALAAPSVALLVNRIQAADQRFELTERAAAGRAACGLPGRTAADVAAEVKVWRRELAHEMIFPAAAGEATGTMAAATGAE
jgi:DNA-binding winged helix-turn-helix (wHTH) protein